MPQTDINARLPASVTVSFPRYASGSPTGGIYAPGAVTLASLALAEAGGKTGHAGSHYAQLSAKALAATGDPSNASALQSLAIQYATDWYRWQLGWVDEAMAGTVAWELEGLHDVEWSNRPGHCLTRVRPSSAGEARLKSPQLPQFLEVIRVNANTPTSGLYDAYVQTCSDPAVPTWADLDRVWGLELGSKTEISTGRYLGRLVGLANSRQVYAFRHYREIDQLDGKNFYFDECISGRVWRYKQTFLIENGEARLADPEFDSFQGCCDCSGSPEPPACCDLPETLCVDTNILGSFIVAYDPGTETWYGSGMGTLSYGGPPAGTCEETISVEVECSADTAYDLFFRVYIDGVQVAEYLSPGLGVGFCTTGDTGWFWATVAHTLCNSQPATSIAVRIHDCTLDSGSVSGSQPGDDPDDPDDDCPLPVSLGGSIPNTLTLTFSGGTGTCSTCLSLGGPVTLTYEPVSGAWQAQIARCPPGGIGGIATTLSLRCVNGTWSLIGSGHCQISAHPNTVDYDPLLIVFGSELVVGCCSGSISITVVE